MPCVCIGGRSIGVFITPVRLGVEGGITELLEYAQTLRIIHVNAVAATPLTSTDPMRLRIGAGPVYYREHYETDIPPLRVRALSGFNGVDLRLFSLFNESLHAVATADLFGAVGGRVRGREPVDAPDDRFRVAGIRAGLRIRPRR